METNRRIIMALKDQFLADLPQRNKQSSQASIDTKTSYHKQEF